MQLYNQSLLIKMQSDAEKILNVLDVSAVGHNIVVVDRTYDWN